MKNNIMKSMKLIGLSLVIMAGALMSVRGGEFRTDINPALKYYLAFTMAPDLPPADRDFLFNTDWRGQKLPDRFGELVGRYDQEFVMVREAAQATVPCDWGIDWSKGPGTLLPHLARAKAVAVAARLRAMWDLQQGKQAEARDDLLAAFVMGRNTSRDGSLISVLVQIAMENIVCSTVAENYYRFSPETLKQLADGMDGAPARGTMAAAMAFEKSCFHGWLLNRILQMQKENPGDDAKVMEMVRQVFDYEGGDSGQKEPSPWPKILAASGGTSEGVIKLLRDMETYYDRITAIMSVPVSNYEDQIKQFDAEVQSSPNPLVSLLLPALEKARAKEFVIQANLAMVRAAVEYKLQGDAGLQSVTDPCGAGPFALERFVFEGVDRGFELKSAYAGPGYSKVMIFVEKEGPPFNVTGMKVGQAPSK